MGRESLMKKQKLQREAKKAGHTSREAINKYVKNKVDKTGTTWVNRDNKIIQADSGRNKGRKFKEKVGQDIGKVRSRQKARENVSKGDVKGLAGQAGNWLKNNLKIKNTDLSKRKKTKVNLPKVTVKNTDLSKPRKKTKITFNSSSMRRKKK